MYSGRKAKAGPMRSRLGIITKSGRGGSIAAAAAKSPKAKPKKKPKPKRAKVLCKVKNEDGYQYTFYQDHTFKSSWWGPDATLSEWEIVYSDKFGPMLFQRDISPNSQEWTTSWSSENKDEKRMAEAILRALGDIEVEKMLKGES